ncbi:hypothetical protein KW795_00845 [Candidatus Microgenomates bacterium]|nr:hypothetical protein [Candidatus Microgenomates bacterium]
MAEELGIINNEIQKNIAGEPINLDHLQTLLHLSSQELTDILMSNPPVKEVRPPTPEEIEVSQKETPTPTYIETEDDRESFQYAMYAFKNYLQRNTIIDTFEDHHKRAKYEDALNGVLSQLDNLKNQKDLADNYTKTWKSAWDNNKYTRGSMGNVSGALGLLSLLPLPQDIQDKFAKDTKIITEIITPGKIDKSRTDEETDVVINIAISTINQFAQE